MTAYFALAAFMAPGCVIPSASPIFGQEWPAARASAMSSARLAGMAFMRSWNARRVSRVGSVTHAIVTEVAGIDRACYSSFMSTTSRVAGHAYRPTKNPYSAYRGWFTGCECGDLEPNHGPVPAKTARWLHAEHKAAVLRAERSGQ